MIRQAEFCEKYGLRVSTVNQFRRKYPEHAEAFIVSTTSQRHILVDEDFFLRNKKLQVEYINKNQELFYKLEANHTSYKIAVMWSKYSGKGYDVCRHWLYVTLFYNITESILVFSISNNHKLFRKFCNEKSITSS